MVNPEQPRGLLGRRETMDPAVQRSLDNGLSKILNLVLEELTLFYDRDVNGVGVLYSLLRAPWLQALLKVHECLHQYMKKRPVPVVPKARSLSHEVVELLREYPQSGEMKELKRLLRTPHFKAFLHAHDSVAQKDFEPTLPPLPDNIPDTEEAMRIVCLVKNKQPLGATIKRHETTGEIMVARVINGGLADRSGLLYAGDKLVEVNGIPVEGLEPEHVIQILTESHGTIMFKVVPVSDRPVNNQTMLHVRAMADYSPQRDPAIPCADAGLPFRKGDILQIVDQNDALWWQARKISDFSICAGLIPSNHLLKRKQREFWWSQPFQPHTCLKSPILTTVEEEEDMRIDEKCVETDEETFESEELREEDEEFTEYGQRIFIAGFRRSFRLCRRKSHSNQTFCYSRCPSSCYSSGAAPYEEVVRYQRRPTDRHRLIVLVGPSGVGVNELRRRLIGINPNTFQSAVPHTTRPQKSYENNGYEYHFVTREVFESMVYSHRFLEYGEYKGNLYGTSVDSVRAVLDEGKVCIVDLDPQVFPRKRRFALHCNCVSQFQPVAYRTHFSYTWKPEAIQGIRNHEVKPYVIFIRPPSVGCMRQTRRNARIITDYFVNMKYKEEDFQEIEETAKKMEAQYCQYFDRVIVNDNLQAASVQLLSAIRSAQEEPQWVPASWICSNT